MKRLLTNARLYRLLPIVVAGLLAGCSADDRPGGGSHTGYITPSVAIDSKAIVAQARATMPEDVRVDDLSLTLTSTDGSYKHTWTSPDLFPTKEEFKAGRYTMSASYGTEGEEGFEKPHFSGETQLNVVADETTVVSLTASLTNSMISVEYTEAFKSYMTSYSASLAGKSITFEAGETRPAYVNPGEVALNVYVTKPNGKSATLNAANFAVQPRHHYHVTVDVNEGGVGDAVLVVEFDDMLDIETVEIDLSDALFDAPAPIFTPVGFSEGDIMELVEGTVQSQTIAYNLAAFGGIRTVSMTTVSPSLVAAGWPADVQLCAASLAQQDVMKTHGLVCRGLWSKPDRMAVVDFTDVLPNLRYVEGKDNVSTFTLTASDALSKSSEPVTLSVKVLPLELNVTAVSQLMLGDESFILDVDYNGADFAHNVVVEYLTVFGEWAEMNVSTIESESDGKYKITVDAPDTKSSYTVRLAYYNGRTSAQTNVLRTMPPFSLSVDAIDVYATHATVTLECSTYSSAELAEIADYIISVSGGSNKPATASVNGDRIEITDLQPSTNYTLRATAGTSEAMVRFTTETAAQLPNSGMDTWFRVDGKTKYWWIDYPGSDTNAVWGTLNQLTTSVGDGNTSMFSHKGTSYCAFSGTRNTTDVHSGPNAAIISTVGWGDNDANGSTSTGKGCKHLTVGQLYLGHYDSSTQSPVYTGIDFASRPVQLVFWYKYVHKNSSDFGTAEIEIKDASGNIIGSGSVELRTTAEYTKVPVNITYTRRAKAANVMVAFKSSGNPECQTINTTNLSCPSFGNLSDGRFTGSELYIDDIELIY